MFSKIIVNHKFIIWTISYSFKYSSEKFQLFLFKRFQLQLSGFPIKKFNINNCISITQLIKFYKELLDTLKKGLKDFEATISNIDMIDNKNGKNIAYN